MWHKWTWCCPALCGRAERVCKQADPGVYDYGSNQEEVFLCNSKPGSQALASPGKGKLPPDQQTLQALQCQSLRNMNIRSPLPIPVSLSHPLPQPQRVSLSLCHPGSPTTRSVDKTGLKLKDPPASASWELKSCATIPAPAHPRCPSPVRQAPGQAGGQPFSHSSRRTHLRHWGLTTPGTGVLLVSLDPCTQQKPRTQPLPLPITGLRMKAPGCLNDPQVTLRIAWAKPQLSAARC